MRKEVKRIRVLVIRKLVRSVGRLKSKKLVTCSHGPMTNKMSKVVFIQYLQNLRVGPVGIIKYLTHATLGFIWREALSGLHCAVSAYPCMVWATLT